MTYIYTQNELAHYGILGQKWGVRRFQNPDGTLTEAGKKRYGTVENFEAGRTKKQAEKHEKEKQKAIASGKTSEIQKFSKELSKEEMEKAFKRIDDEQKLAELNQKDIVLGQKKLQNIIDVGGKVKLAAETVRDIYNVTASVYNAFNKSGNQWPIIGQERKDPKKQSLDDQKKQFDLDREKQRWEWEQEKHNAKTAESTKGTNKEPPKAETPKSNKTEAPKQKDFSQGEYSQKYKTASPITPRELPEHDSSYSQKYRDATPRSTAGYLPSSGNSNNSGTKSLPTGPSSGGSTPKRFEGKTVIDADYKEVSRTPVLALPPHTSSTTTAANKVASSAGSTKVSNITNKTASDLMKENNSLLNQMYDDLLK